MWWRIIIIIYLSNWTSILILVVILTAFWFWYSFTLFRCLLLLVTVLEFYIKPFIQSTETDKWQSVWDFLELTCTGIELTIHRELGLIDISYQLIFSLIHLCITWSCLPLVTFQGLNSQSPGDQICCNYNNNYFVVSITTKMRLMVCE